MPIKTVDLSQKPGFLVQFCRTCALEHMIRFDRAAVETKPEPFALSEGGTLALSLDGAAAMTITVTKADAKSLAAMTAVELKAKLNTISGVLASVTPAGTLLIESASTGPNSAVQFTGGSSLAALGRDWGRTDPCPGRPVLGVSDGRRANKDSIALRRCGCGTFDILNRTWDVAPAELAGSFFYEHRKAVNSLGEYFKAQGWVHPDLAADLKAETTSPADRFPAGTTTISVPPAS